MKNKGHMPEVLFIAPIGHYKEKKRFIRVVLLIEEWDNHGRPRKATILRPDEPAQSLEESYERGAEFLTSYVQAVAIDPCPDKRNKRVK